MFIIFHMGNKVVEVLFELLRISLHLGHLWKEDDTRSWDQNTLVMEMCKKLIMYPTNVSLKD